MAIIGARPATLWGIPLRLRRRVSPPPRPGARRRGGSMSRVDASSLGALIAAAVVLALFYLTQSTQVAAMGYQIAQLEAELAERRAAQQQLIWEIGRARSPAEIEARARSELRLKPLKPEVIRFAPLSTEIDR